jgi:uncharacterized protein (DUF58 family)
VTARRIVDGFLAGKNKSNRYGFSVEFVEHREYSPGDDLRHLDWKVLGRLDRYYIKRYEEETNITAMLVLDTSASMNYSSGTLTKFEVAATAASALGHLFNRQRDAVGLALFADELQAFQPPSVRVASLAGLVARLQEAVPQGKTGLESALQRVVREVSRRCLVVILSDLFMEPKELASCLQFLQYHGHEAVVLQVLDDAELTFPFRKNTLFRGLEDAREYLTEPHRLRTRYLDKLEEFLGAIRKTCEASAFDYQLINTHEDLGQTLATLVAQRNRRQRVTRRGKGF